MDHEEIKAEDLVMEESFRQYCLGHTESARMYWENWLAEHPACHEEFLKAKQLFYIINGNHSDLSFKKDQEAFQSRLKKEGILKDESAQAKVVDMPVKAKRTPHNWLFRFSAAAVILVIVAAGVFLMYHNTGKKEGLADQAMKKVKIERSPGGNKATLTLGDGSTIILDSASNGLVSQQGTTKIIKVGDQLTYENGHQNTEVVFNTISTPKGGQYQLVLSDGSKVWLNASSSLRFPSSFKGNERNVELKGEGYFEIAHNAGKPFHVNANGVEVEVLGTHFNVMAYTDESILKTTLVEGKVKVKKGNEIVLLQPGQQAKVYQQGTIELEKHPDVEEELAWKNGLFQFSGADVSTIMRQIERWYNIDTEIRGDMRNIHLSGKVSRNLNLSQVIEVLEASGIDVKSEGNKIVASPKP